MHTEPADCIFCKLAHGKIPCLSLYEDDHIFAFLDIGPAAPGHALIVSKAHYRTVFDCPDTLGSALLRGTRIVGKAVMRAVAADGFNVVQNNFAAAGQEIFHAHWHIIPRMQGDALFSWTSKPYADAAAGQELRTRILAQITSGK